MATPAEILFFWFLNPSYDKAYVDQRMALWFRKDDRTDQALAERFGGDVKLALKGELDSWAEFSRNRLALILLLDQLPRNLYRGTPQAFSGDPKALALCLEGLDRGHDARLHPIERTFYYLPLEHSEDLALQERSVQLFTQLVDEATPEAHSFFNMTLDYARRHRDIVERFGRFPHRNTILSRQSTDEELAFLQQPGSSF